MKKVLLFLLLSLYSQVDALLDYKCLKCLCKTATNCEPEPCDSKTCQVSSGNYNCACGFFAITPPYWISANKPSLNAKYKNDQDKFVTCVLSKSCSIRTVQYYMEKYAKDCNKNKVIDCDDYVLIHSFGPGNCEGSSLESEKLQRYNTCMGKQEASTTPSPKPKITKPNLINETSRH